MYENLEDPLIDSNDETDLPNSRQDESQEEVIQRKIYIPNRASITSWDAKTNEVMIYTDILPISIFIDWGRPMTCITSDNQLFIYGGFNKNCEAIKEAMIIDLVSMQAKLVKSGRKRGAAGLARLGCQIYIFGGVKNVKSSYKECDKYDLLTNKWASIAPLPLKCGSVYAEVFGSDILVSGYHLAGLYYYSVGKNNYSKIFDLPRLEKKMIFAYHGKVWIYCDHFGSYESRRYDLTNWDKIGTISGMTLFLTQHVRIGSTLYFGDKAMDKWTFNLRNGVLGKL